MKKNIILFFLILFSGYWTMASAQKTGSFTLNGKIDDLRVGDTIFIENIHLPDWKTLLADTVYVESANEFVYNKNIDHTTFLLLSHSPKDLPKKVSSVRGASVLIKKGDKIELKGSADYIGALSKKGGFYDDSLIARLDSLENIHNIQLIDIYRKLSAARATQQTDSINIYAAMYQKHTAPQEYKDLRNYLLENVNDNEYVVYLYLEGLYNVPFKKLEERFNKYMPEIQNSDMGQQLNKMRKVLKNIEVGNQSSGFTVTDKDGKIIKLSDYKGKYTLIYNWGLCPGTIWVHPKLLELYANFKDKGFDLIGFSPYDYFGKNPETVVAEEIKPLLNQPWTTVYTDNPDNTFIENDYYLAVVPILMLISPDGTTLVRGYSEVFESVKNILEENLSQK